MTVPTSDNREEYTGNDVTTSFDYAFKIFEDSDLQVYLQAADGTETLLALNTDYSVSGAGDLAGGSVTYPLSGDPLASDEKLIILRVLEVVQETDLRNQGAYYPQVIEDELDRSRMIDQQQQEEINRALKRPAAEDGYDADGRQIKNGAAATDGSDFVIKSQVDNRFASDVITKTAGNWDAKGLRLLALQTSDTPQSDEAVNRQHMEAYFNSVVLGGGPYANLRSELISPDAGQGSDLVAYTGTAETITEATDRQQIEIDDRVIRVSNLAELKALTAVSDHQASLSGLRSGIFKFDPSDLSTEVTNDPQEGIYVAPDSDATGASGAWVRVDAYPFKAEWFGAVGDGVTDDYAAINAAIGRGTTVLEAKRYLIGSALNIVSDSVELIGQGDFNGGTELISNLETGDKITISGQHSKIRNIWITQTGPITAGSAIRIQGGFRNEIRNVRIDGVYNGVRVDDTTEAVIQALTLRNIAGVAGVEVRGTQGAGSYRCVIDDMRADNPDNGNNLTTWILQENFAYSLVIDKAALINGGVGFAMKDSASTGSSYPVWAFVWDLECDNNETLGVFMEAGEGLFINGSWIGSCNSGNGVTFGSAFRGTAFIGGGTRIHGNAQHGVLINAGPIDVKIDSCFIGDNSAGSPNSFNGIEIAPNAERFTVTNNKSGDLVATSGNDQLHGLNINPGASDYFVVVGNDFTGNGGAAFNNDATGQRYIIENNLPDNIQKRYSVVMLDGTTSVSIAHGFDRTPNFVQCTPRDGVGSTFWATADATNITVFADSAVTGGKRFDIWAELR